MARYVGVVIISVFVCVCHCVAAGLPGTNRPNYCRPQYKWNTMNIQSYTAAGFTMNNHYVSDTAK